jgi:type II secretory pathway predicted ATPase ExeA
MGETHRLVSPARVFARPTADEIWLGAAQRAALSQLSRPARIRMIVGPTSSGKTTLLRYLGTQLHSDAVVLHCRGPKADAAAVLASLLLGADLAPWELSEIEQRNLLTVFVQQRHMQNRRVLLLVDDAHGFEAPALEELERLLAFKVDKKPAFELLVAGTAAIAEHWQQACARLTGCDVLVHALAAASQQDLIGYLEWRLGRFGMENLMTPVALQMIARLSDGHYSAADVLSQMSLLLLRQLMLERADARVVRQAVATLVDRQSAKVEAAARSRGEQRPEAPPHGYTVISHEGKVISRVALRQRTSIGRSGHNDICLPSPYVSRHHAVIVGTPHGYYVVDLNSVNGVSLNGQRIERSALFDDDVLGLGPFRLKLQVPEWLAQSSSLPDEASLSETVVMPQQTEENTAIWRVR